jgi:hypothetical protein
VQLVKALRKHVFPNARLLDLPLLEMLMATLERGVDNAGALGSGLLPSIGCLPTT